MIINENDIIYLQIGPMNTRINIMKEQFFLEKPACIDKKMMIILSKNINNKFNIIGYGYI